MRILIVEDEPGIYRFLEKGLQEEGYETAVATTGQTGFDFGKDGNFDLILLDWMLPGISGIEVCRHLRTAGIETPVIFLTARDTVQDTVFALEMGANDYIKKPFSFEELLARVHVQLREKLDNQAELSTDDLRMNLSTHRVYRGDQEVKLTQKEFELLEFLLKNKGRVCTRSRIIEQVWDIHFDYDTAVIDVHINSIRKKINIDTRPDVIRTVRGVGYMIDK